MFIHRTLAILSMVIAMSCAANAKPLYSHFQNNRGRDQQVAQQPRQANIEPATVLMASACDTLEQATQYISIAEINDEAAARQLLNIMAGKKVCGIMQMKVLTPDSKPLKTVYAANGTGIFRVYKLQVIAVRSYPGWKAPSLTEAVQFVIDFQRGDLL